MFIDGLAFCVVPGVEIVLCNDSNRDKLFQEMLLYFVLYIRFNMNSLVNGKLLKANGIALL